MNLTMPLRGERGRDGTPIISGELILMIVIAIATVAVAGLSIAVPMMEERDRSQSSGRVVVPIAPPLLAGQQRVRFDAEGNSTSIVLDAPVAESPRIIALPAPSAPRPVAEAVARAPIRRSSVSSPSKNGYSGSRPVRRVRRDAGSVVRAPAIPTPTPPAAGSIASGRTSTPAVGAAPREMAPPTSATITPTPPVAVVERSANQAVQTPAAQAIEAPKNVASESSRTGQDARRIDPRRAIDNLKALRRQ